MTAQTADGAAKRTRVRWLIILLLFVITTINYADRATFSIAGQSASKELGLDPVAMGYILSAFAWAYVLGQIPGGACWTASGPRRSTRRPGPVVGLHPMQGFAGIFSGLAAAVALFAMRFMVGLAESPSFPANARIVAAWFPGPERGTASAIFNSAQYFSLVAFAPLMGWLVHSSSAGVRCSS
jgi:ACS family glucarate transporter-like MFS transporter